jgi:ABC-type multidrug transport system fused ATPase/permease subunit
VSEYFHEDEILGRAFDARLMRRLLRFLTPYRALFAITVALTMLIAGIQLGIPFLTKIAIDDYMTLAHAIARLDAAPEYGRPIDLGDGRYLVETMAVPRARRPGRSGPSGTCSSLETTLAPRSRRVTRTCSPRRPPACSPRKRI